jgi:hypothetical protein
VRGVEDEAGLEAPALVGDRDEAIVLQDVDIGQFVQAVGADRGDVETAGVHEAADALLRGILRIERHRRGGDADRLALRGLRSPPLGGDRAGQSGGRGEQDLRDRGHHSERPRA